MHVNIHYKWEKLLIYLPVVSTGGKGVGFKLKYTQFVKTGHNLPAMTLTLSLVSNHNVENYLR